MLQGRWSKFFQGGGEANANVNIERVNFQGGGGPDLWTHACV